MVLVRIAVQTKWGQAEPVVQGYKKFAAMIQKVTGKKVPVRILTDLSGQFFTVVEEIEVESLGAWESLRATVFASPEFQQSQMEIGDVFETGRLEFYTIEAEY